MLSRLVPPTFALLGIGCFVLAPATAAGTTQPSDNKEPTRQSVVEYAMYMETDKQIPAIWAYLQTFDLSGQCDNAFGGYQRFLVKHAFSYVEDDGMEQLNWYKSHCPMDVYAKVWPKVEAAIAQMDIVGEAAGKAYDEAHKRPLP